MMLSRFIANLRQPVLSISSVPAFLRGVVFAMAIGAMGCGGSPPPVKKEPSLESQDPKERSDAARKAADDYGAK